MLLTSGLVAESLLTAVMGFAGLCKESTLRVCRTGDKDVENNAFAKVTMACELIAGCNGQSAVGWLRAESAADN